VTTIPPAVRDLLDAPNYVHLSTLKRDGTPRNWVVWAGLEDEHVLICACDYCSCDMSVPAVEPSAALKPSLSSADCSEPS
jgi:hypothetical protein